MAKAEKVRIGYKDFTIRHVKSINSGASLGLCRKTDGEIKIATGQSAIEQANTTLHEVLHALVYTQGVDVPYKTEEAMVNALANGLIGFFRDNPKFILRLLRSIWKK